MVKTVRSNADIVKPVKYATRKMVVVLLVLMDMQEHNVKMVRTTLSIFWFITCNASRHEAIKYRKQ